MDKMPPKNRNKFHEAMLSNSFHVQMFMPGMNMRDHTEKSHGSGIENGEPVSKNPEDGRPTTSTRHL